MHDARLAFRISNLIAIALLFLTGYAFGRRVTRHPWWTGVLMVIIGGILVAITMALGG
jgi:VIT1/CCC1 family predicted Fe2+/Mn2+ transporter